MMINNRDRRECALIALFEIIPSLLRTLNSGQLCLVSCISGIQNEFFWPLSANRAYCSLNSGRSWKMANGVRQDQWQWISYSEADMSLLMPASPLTIQGIVATAVVFHFVLVLTHFLLKKKRSTDFSSFLFMLPFVVLCK